MKKNQINVQDIIKQTPSCLKVIDQKGRLLKMNDKGLSLIEAENLDSVFLADVYSLVHPEDRERFIEFNERICRGESGHLTFKIIGLKGTHRLMESYAAPITLEDGAIGHVAITNDITAIKKVKKINEDIAELRNNFFFHSDSPSHFFDFLLEKIIKMTGSEYGFIGEMDSDDEGLLLRTYAITDISWNNETRKFYQEYKDIGLIFRNLDSLFGEVMTSQKLLLTNDPQKHPSSGGLPSGHPDLLAFLGVPLFSGGKMIAMCGLANCPGGFQQELVNDIQPYFDVVAELVARFQLEQENKKKEKLLLETTERLELALEGSKLGIWDWCLKDNSVKFDQRWGEMLGIPYEELEMNLDTWKTRVHPDDIDACFKDINEYLEGKTEHYMNIHRMKHAKGHWVYILDQGKVSEFDGAGKPIRFTGTHLDVTLQKEQENEITSAKNKAVLAERSKSQFLATMSHEIRTPLNGVLGMAELLQDTNLNQEQREMIESIRTSGDSLMTILNDILDLSKMDAGKMELEKKEFSLGILIKDVTGLMSVKADEKGIELNIDSVQKVFLEGDIIRLKQILINLVSNSIKFTQKGSVNIVANYSSVDKVLELTVSDTGIGISREDQEKLFNDFTQADSSTTRKYGGTGLGLSICKKLVDLMNGQIILDSEINQGTSIKVTIPIIEVTKPKQNKQESQKVLLKTSKNILIVEDNSTNQIIICRLLEKLGQKIITADNGKEAYDIYCRDHKEIDLIFMDMQMPILDGLEATKLIRKESFGREIPIIALTANAFDSDEQLCLEAGMNDFLTKPIQKSKLISILSKYID